VGGGGGVSGGAGRGGASATAGASGTGGSAAGAAGVSGTGGGAAGTGGAPGTGGGGAGTGGASGTTGTSGTGGGGAAGAAGAGTGGGAGAGGRGGSAAGAGGTGGGGATAGTGGTTTGAGGIAGGAAGAGGVAGGGGAGTTGTGGACVTSVSGTVYDPAGVLPLYNVSVYAPTTALTPIAEGTTCDRCGQPSGTPAAMALSDTKGTFTLTGISPGVNVPIVFQVGKWRREVTIPTVAACANTPLTDANLTRLPRTKTEGHIPKIAVTTAGADALECFIRRIGIADTEFTDEFGAGRVHLYAGGDGTASFEAGGSFTAATTLWSNRPKLASYDMIAMGCEGSVSKFIDQKPQTSVDNIAAYANGGGRLLFSHYGFQWLQRSPDFSATAAYVGSLNPPTAAASDPINLTVNTTSPKGAAFADWLAGPIVMASPTRGQIAVAGLEHSVTGVVPPTTEWIYLASNPQASNQRSSQYLSFNTPVGTPEANQCGRVIFTDMHVKQSVSTVAGAGGDDSDPGKPFPSGCKINAGTPQMKALEFLFFELGACR